MFNLALKLAILIVPEEFANCMKPRTFFSEPTLWLGWRTVTRTPPSVGFDTIGLKSLLSRLKVEMIASFLIGSLEL